MSTAQPTPTRPRIGVVLVHGIGEQRRFEHIDAQVREIVHALRARASFGSHTEVTVEIETGSAASFAAEQDSWAVGSAAPVRAIVRDAPTNCICEICFHEVWWADSNEHYSLFKQFRFWWWGLVIAFIPLKLHSSNAAAASMHDPIAPGGSTAVRRLWVRVRLFGVSFVAVLGAASVGLLMFLAKRILKLDPPDVVKVFVNYVAGVKLYNQKHRKGPGFPARNADFLDSIGDPPRVAVRRRMIRALAAASCANYGRWYVIAHSLGTVVAFNGLMESPYVWPGYFTEADWNQLVARNLAGPANPAWLVPAGSNTPNRPVWCHPSHIAYRSALFEHLHGVLMIGSPLEKFATLWPGRVPISSEPAFRLGTEWLNVYDPVDPISGVLRAYDTIDPNHCPQPETIGYAADSRLFLSHIRYLTWRPGGKTLADGLADWLLTGQRTRIKPDAGPRWFDYTGKPALSRTPTPAPTTLRHLRRTIAAWLWWLAATALLTLLGSLALPPLLTLLQDLASKLWSHLATLAAVSEHLPLPPTTLQDRPPPLTAIILQHALWLLLAAIAFPAAAGLIARLVMSRDNDDSRTLKPAPQHPETFQTVVPVQAHPEPNPRYETPWPDSHEAQLWHSGMEPR